MATINGTVNNDTLNGTANNDDIYGAAGNDSIRGLEGNDTLYGEAGNDTVNPGVGSDNVYGGEGSDLLIVDYSVNDSGGGMYGYGNGYYQRYNSLGSAVDYTNTSEFERFQITGTSYIDNISGADGADTLTSGTGNDTLDGQTGNDSLTSGIGNDSLTSGGGIDKLDGGTGNDTLADGNFGSATTALSINDTGSSIITLTDGTDVRGIEQFNSLTTGSGNDSISFSRDLDNTINTDTGNDTVNAGLGSDNVNGGGGNDLLIVNYSSGDTGGGLGGNSGGYYVRYDNTGNWVDSVYNTNFERVQITGTTYNDNFSGGTGNDTLSSGAGNDTLDGQTGNDSLTSGDGNDSITSGGGIDKVDGGTGNDTLADGNFGSATTALSINDAGTTVVTLADGTDVRNIEQFNSLTTGSGNDSISFSRDLDNTINTGSGNDTVNAGLGNDNADGGDGNDLLIVDYSVNNSGGRMLSQWWGYERYNSFNVRVDYASIANFERVQVTGTTYSDVISSGAGNDTLTSGAGNDILNSGEGNDSVSAGTGNDRITPGTGIDKVDGGDGNDTLIDGNFETATTGLTISDTATNNITLTDGTEAKGIEVFTGTLTTGSGNDSISFSRDLDNNISTGSGNDTVNAGLGNDNVDGGEGNDLLIVDYSLNPAGGRMYGYAGYYERYNSFNSRVDYVSHSNFERFQITGTAYSDNISTGTGDDTVTSGAGNDILNSGEGNDSLSAGTGNDFLTSGTGIDKIDGGDGNDTLAEANLGGATTGLTITDTATNNITLTDGTQLTSIELINNLTTGNGNDSITFSRELNNNIATGEGNDTVNPGLGDDNVDGGTGDDLLILDYSVGDTGGGMYGYPGYYERRDELNNRVDYLGNSNFERFQITGTPYSDNISGGSGNDTLISGAGDDFLTSGTGIDKIDGGSGNDTLVEGNFGTATTDLIISDTATNNITLTDGTEAKGIEQIYNFSTGSGNDSISFTQDLNNSIATGTGNDTVNPGLGADNIDGGEGDDLLIVNYSVNDTGGGIYTPYNGFYGRIDEYGTQVDYVSHTKFERYQVTGTVYSDAISGGTGNDTLNGFGGLDIVTGGEGSDRFILADALKNYYDDLVTTTTGTDDYAEITDFNSTVDTIQLRGVSSNYRLVTNSGNTEVYIDKPGTEPDELIASITGVTGLSLNSAYFQYVVNSRLAFSSANFTVNENGTPVNAVTVTRTGGSSGSVLATVTLTNGTATAPSDYNNSPITVFFGNGQTLRTVTIPVINDTSFEANETVNLTLVNPRDGAGLGTQTTSVLTILDNDTLPQISVSNITVVEGNTTTAGFIFTLNGASPLPVTVQYTTVDGTATAGSDYTGITSATVSFAANETLKTVSVSLLDDTTNEADETFTLNLSNPTNATLGNTQAIGTITDTLTSSATFTLPALVENLTLTGGDNINGTGNTGNNILTGNSGNNSLSGLEGNDTLDGGLGLDSLTGGTGNDTYVVDTTTDVITEAVSAGIDTVESSVTFTIATLTNLENITLTGTAATTATGNSVNNTLTGNSANNTFSGAGGNDTINGGAGSDLLIGGTGNDIYVFAFGQSLATGRDRISDLGIGSDKIDLLTNSGGAVSTPTSLSRAADSTASDLFVLAGQVFTDSDGLTAGNQALGVNGAALAVVTTGSAAGTYVIVNNGVAGFQSADDLIISITGYAGTLPALGPATPSTLFV